jgi:hypothetical protein
MLLRNWSSRSSRRRIAMASAGPGSHEPTGPVRSERAPARVNICTFGASFECLVRMVPFFFVL